jgi:hypothetical protein
MSCLRPTLRCVVNVVLFSFGGSICADEPPSVAVEPSKASLESSIVYLVKDLGSDEFVRRDNASKKLLTLGPEAAAILEKQIQQLPPSAFEARTRASVILEELRDGYSSRPMPDTWTAPKDLMAIHHKGVIAKGEVWSSEFLHVVSETVRVEPGVELRIEPGASVIVKHKSDVIVAQGASLNASGSLEKPIVFSSEPDSPMHARTWGKLTVSGRATISHMQVRDSRGVHFETTAKCAVTGLAIFDTDGDSLTIDARECEYSQVVIREATGAGLKCSARAMLKELEMSGVGIGIVFRKQSSAHLAQSKVSYAREAGIIVDDGSYPTINAVRIDRCPTGMVYSNQSYGANSQVKIAHCKTNGLSVTKGSYPRIEEMEFTDIEGWGVAVSGASYPAVHRLSFGNRVTGEVVLDPESRLRSWAEAARDR